MRQSARFLSILVTVALLVGACSDDKTATPTAAPSTPAPTATATFVHEPGENTVTVTVKEFAVTLDPATAAAGNLNFDVTNSGAVVHEFVIIKTDLDPKALPLDASGTKLDETNLQVIGELEDIAVGATAKGEFELAAGKYVLLCNIEGHYAAGMTTGFVVE